ncbi:DinB/UmuC family translesion DNA polymerase [Actinacidiphila soli]|uniref:DinB/UmuC family translesion DNA polymerase n=1 Tax=Actinacidiphila soli TaxID=2487275 RepID=UPI0038994E14
MRCRGRRRPAPPPRSPGLTVRYADRTSTTKTRTLPAATSDSAALARAAYDLHAVGAPGLGGRVHREPWDLKAPA